MLGSGTTLLAAKKLGRNFVGIDASAKYQRIFERRKKEMFSQQQQEQQQATSSSTATSDRTAIEKPWKKQRSRTSMAAEKRPAD